MEGIKKNGREDERKKWGWLLSLNAERFFFASKNISDKNRRRNCLIWHRTDIDFDVEMLVRVEKIFVIKYSQTFEQTALTSWFFRMSKWNVLYYWVSSNRFYALICDVILRSEIRFYWLYAVFTNHLLYLQKSITSHF